MGWEHGFWSNIYKKSIEGRLRSWILLFSNLFTKDYQRICFLARCSVQFSRSVTSDSLRPHELQHARSPCPSPSPGVYPNSCPSSWWCHPAISSSVVPFSSCPNSSQHQSFPMSQLFAWGGQSIGVSASASVLPMNTQDWSLDGLLGSPCSPRYSQESSPTPQFKSINSSVLSFLYRVQLSHPYIATGKTIALTRRTFVGKVMSLLFNMLSRLVITFLPRSKRLLISWLQSPSAVILELQKIKSDTVSPSICHEVIGPDAMILALSQLFHSPLSSRSFLVPLHFLP